MPELDQVSKDKFIADIKQVFLNIKKTLENIEVGLDSDDLRQYNRAFIFSMTINDLFNNLSTYIEKMFEKLKKEGCIVM